MRFRMFCLFLLLCVAVQVANIEGGSDSEIRCDTVDCTSYKFKIKSLTTPGFQECRIKQRKPPKTERAGFCGLQVHTYGDLERDGTDIEDCPKDGKMIMTEGLKESDLIEVFPNSNYRQCCARKVVKRCYHKVTLFTKENPDAEKKVIKHDYEMNNIDHVLIVFENKNKNKRVTAIFSPNKGTLTCKKEYGGQEKVYVTKKAQSPKRCGDKDIDVRIRTFFNPGTNGSNLMKVKRLDCNSQYVAMFSDPSHRTKFTMRTVVDNRKKRYANRYLGEGKGKVEMAPVFAKISAGKCGKIAKGAEMTSTELFDNTFTDKTGNNISTNKTGNNISTNKTGNNISTNKTGNNNSTNKTGNNNSTDKTGNNNSTDKSGLKIFPKPRSGCNNVVEPEVKTSTNKSEEKTTTDESDDKTTTELEDKTITDVLDDKTTTDELEEKTTTDESNDKVTPKCGKIVNIPPNTSDDKISTNNIPSLLNKSGNKISTNKP